MKNVFVDNTLDAKGFTRQQWRVWIETGKAVANSYKYSRVHPSAMAGVD